MTIRSADFVGNNEKMGLCLLRGISMTYVHSLWDAHMKIIRGSGMAEIVPK